jgi:hypothetical protein
VRSTEQSLGDALLKVDDLNRTDCRAAAQRRFSTQRMVSEHLALYSSIISHR